MGRIRSIKPEILTDSKTAELDDLEWRLFVSLWVVADDYGNLRGDVGYVQGATLWASRHSREDVANALGTLANVELVLLYEVRGQAYIHISGWDKHQKVDKPGKPHMPGPDDQEAKPSRVDGKSSRKSRERLAKVSRDSRETLDTDLRPPTSDLGPPTSDQDRDRPTPARVVWEYQESLRAKVIPGSRPLKATEERLARVSKILDAGNTVDDCRAVLEHVAERCKRDPDQRQWFNGDTTWRPVNFDRELGQVGTTTRRGPVTSFDLGMEYIAGEIAKANAEEDDREAG